MRRAAPHIVNTSSPSLLLRAHLTSLIYVVPKEAVEDVIGGVVSPLNEQGANVPRLGTPASSTIRTSREAFTPSLAAAISKSHLLISLLILVLLFG